MESVGYMEITFINCHNSQVTIKEVSVNDEEKIIESDLNASESHTMEVTSGKMYQALDTNTGVIIPMNGEQIYQIKAPFGYTGILPDYHLYVFIRKFGR